MPRWNRDVSPDAAARAARERFAARMIPDGGGQPLLDLADAPDPEAATGDLDSLLAGGEDHSQPGTRLRWRTSWRVAALLAVVGASLVAWHLWQLADGQATSEPLSEAGASTGPTSPGTTTRAEVTDSPDSLPAAPEGGAGVVVVHVAGAVGKPGVVSLPQGSRVFQAISAAGGAAPNAELAALNLAEVLTDGSKLYVPLVGEAAPPTASSGTGNGIASGATRPPAVGAKININTASLEELGTLPRVGPVTARRILDWRKEHGAFTSVDELDAVDGIGPKLMESLKDLVTVQGG
ncbi:helix-hairpin-helix domain-containing protein [Paenarthrobacter sp. NPDC057981]|uniref:helix-hairpin-helix domain-containing protein n=1 Tax=Paenarthrobacter sp. NPDC057981 TaxID=3346297 RepID=UPI0036DC6F71